MKKARPFSQKRTGAVKHTRSPYTARPQEGHQRGAATLRMRCLHMLGVCRPRVRLPHETPMNEPHTSERHRGSGLAVMVGVTAPIQMQRHTTSS
eukprot:4015164-Pyramimonas_sp.AAC.1